MFQLSKELNVVGLNSKQCNESKDCKSLRNTRSTDSFVNSYQIDDDNTYGYSESKPLANNMGNQSFVNFKNDSDSKFDSFIANLQKQKSERRKRRRHQLQMLKKKHQEESERNRIELENSEIK